MQAAVLLVAVTYAAVAHALVTQMPVTRHPSKMENTLASYRGKSSTHSARARERACGRCANYASAYGPAPLEPINYQNSYILGTVSIGTPGQNLTVLLDTGSSIFWVIDANCVSINCRGTSISRRQFDKSASSTYGKKWTKFEANYAGGTAKGWDGQDQVIVAGLTTAEQTFGLANSLSNEMANLPFEGILGMALPNEKDGGRNAMAKILPQLDQPVVTFFMKTNVKYESNPRGGRVTFGGSDSENCEDEIHYVPIVERDLWQFTISLITVGKTSFPVTGTGVSDTGASTLILPKDAFTEVIQQTGAQWDKENNMHMVFCSGNYPVISFKIHGKDFAVHPKEYVINVNHGEECGLAVVEATSFYVNYTVVGSPFHRTYCTTYNYDLEKLGFSKAKHA